mmetsp:Transcript_83450/g.259180  ORF Transcript_83450/g.259180 Transcript_83450/m.259180 type:complete len:304 (-) Transcript_83450:235-1146(-)
MEGIAAGAHGLRALPAGHWAEVLADGGTALGLVAAPAGDRDLAAALPADLDVAVRAAGLDLQRRVAKHVLAIAALLRADVAADGILVPLQRDGAAAAVPLLLEVRAVVARHQPIGVLASHGALCLAVSEGRLAVDLRDVGRGGLEHVDLRVGLGDLQDLHRHAVGLVEVYPAHPEAGVLLRGRVAGRVDELGVGLVPLLLHQEDPAAVALGAGPEGDPEVPGVARERDADPSHLAGPRPRLRVVRRDDHSRAEPGEVPVSHGVDGGAGEPAQAPDVAQTVVQAEDVRVVPHPVKGVAVLQGCR